MNYELLLDEIMVNSVGAKEIIWASGKEIHYGVCPLQLEYHTSIFLAGALLSFGQNRPMLFLIQVEELTEDVMIFDGEIGPHFWKRYQLWAYGNSFPRTSEKAYHYLDKLFAYTAVLNSRVDHQVIFVKKGVKVWSLSAFLKEQISKGYGLLVLSNAYQNIPSWEAKELSAELIAQCKAEIMDEDLQEKFPAFACLHRLCQGYEGEVMTEHLINTADMGLDAEKSTSLWCMLR